MSIKKKIPKFIAKVEKLHESIEILGKIRRTTFPIIGLTKKLFELATHQQGGLQASK